MKEFLSKWVSAAFLAALIVVFISSAAQASEKKKVSGTSKAHVISLTISEPGDKPHHTIAQTVREETLTSTDADWNNVKALMVDQSDLVAGSGSLKGYMRIIHNNGDESYGTYAGTNKLTKAGAAWEVAVEGTMQFNGGTGKFKDLKGSGSYKGTSTPTGSTYTWESEVEY